LPNLVHLASNNVTCFVRVFLNISMAQFTKMDEGLPLPFEENRNSLIILENLLTKRFGKLYSELYA
jgi:hypothetical protein